MATATLRLQTRRDTSVNWVIFNPILLSGELGLETDTRLMKAGNGVDDWVTLAYLPYIEEAPEDGTSYVRQDGIWVQGSSGGSATTVSDTAPSTPAAGDYWITITTNELSVYTDDGTWEAITYKSEMADTVGNLTMDGGVF